MAKRRAWRDIGGGKVQCDITGEIKKTSEVRGETPPDHGRVVQLVLTEEEWKKLNALAEARSTPKHRMTPEECLRRFIRSCQPDGLPTKTESTKGKDT